MAWMQLLKEALTVEPQATLRGEIDTRTPIGIRDVVSLLMME